MDDQSSPLLAALVSRAPDTPADLLVAIERCAEHAHVAEGTVLVRQHDRVRELVVLVAGRVATQLTFSGVGALTVEITELPGRIFGWSALRDPGRATATVRAETACTVALLPLDALVGDRPARVAALCELVAAGLADRAQEIATRGLAVDDA